MQVLFTVVSDSHPPTIFAPLSPVPVSTIELIQIKLKGRLALISEDFGDTVFRTQVLLSRWEQAISKLERPTNHADIACS